MPRVSKLARKLKGVNPLRPSPKCKEPVWKGPEIDGVTQSILSRFLCCRERFRLRVVEGLAPEPQFNYRLEYGQMWHICEEQEGKGLDYLGDLKVYCRRLCKTYPLAQEQIVHWMNVCKIQFPLYLTHWKRRDRKKRTWELTEETFDIHYALPSGRIVRLRGKWDGVFKRKNRILRENKTKGRIIEQQVKSQLSFDLQTMLYVVAYNFDPGRTGELKGVEYNVVRRPLSGGKGTIRRHKATKTKPEETQEHFYGRVKEVIRDDPGTFFMRWDVDLTKGDVDRFRREFLDPVLEQLCDWWRYINGGNTFVGSYDNPQAMHWRYPFGIYNALNEGGSLEIDEFLATGSELGLTRGQPLFQELD